MPYRASIFDRTVTLKSYAPNSDNVGGTDPDASFVLLQEGEPASFKGLKGVETNEGGMISASSNFLFIIRYRNDIGARDMIVLDDGTEYDIFDVTPDGRRNEVLRIMAKARRVK